MISLKSASLLFAATVPYVITLVVPLTVSSCYRDSKDRVEPYHSQQQFDSKNQDDNSSLLNKDRLLDTVKKSAQSLGAIFDEKSSKLEQSAKQEVSKLFTLEYKVVFIKSSELTKNPNLGGYAAPTSQKTSGQNQSYETISNATTSTELTETSPTASDKHLPYEQTKSRKLGASIYELQEALSQLGADSWDCYNLLDTLEGTRLTCRRPSQSYLRWILKRNPLGF